MLCGTKIKITNYMRFINICNNPLNPKLLSATCMRKPDIKILPTLFPGAGFMGHKFLVTLLFIYSIYAC